MTVRATYNEALKCNEKSLAIGLKVLGEEHPNEAITQQSILECKKNWRK